MIAQNRWGLRPSFPNHSSHAIQRLTRANPQTGCIEHVQQRPELRPYLSHRQCYAIRPIPTFAYHSTNVLPHRHKVRFRLRCQMGHESRGWNSVDKRSFQMSQLQQPGRHSVGIAILCSFFVFGAFASARSPDFRRLSWTKGSGGILRRPAWPALP